MTATTAGAFRIGGDPALESALRSGMEAVEELLRRSVASDYPFVTETSRHLVDAGGKRFRPLLTLLAAQFGDPTAAGVVPAAVVVELTHLATLYHDDVMDEAAMRRGAESANSRWDNTVAILTGDFLFARASDLLADLGPEAVRIQARTFERLVTGQIRETVGPEAGQDAVEHHLQVLADKTGSLIATSARFGSMLAGADPAHVDVLTRFGERIGVAFQLADDLLDIESESGVSGKTPGTDLREGVATLPVLLLRQRVAGHGTSGSTTAETDTALVELLDRAPHDDAAHAAALAALRPHPVMAEARAVLQRWVDEARAALAPLPEIPARAALAALCDAVGERSA
ncbi:MAG: polyprenyl synthetase family protein [Actinomycetales bacterium]